MQHRDFFGNSTDLVFELYYEPVVVVGASPVAIAPRPENFSVDDYETTATIHVVESFADGVLACRNKLYGAGVGAGQSGGMDVTAKEIVFPAHATLGVKAFRAGGTGEARCIFRTAWYETGPIVGA